jgi:hypothetical protein
LDICLINNNNKQTNFPQDICLSNNNKQTFHIGYLFNKQQQQQTNKLSTLDICLIKGIENKKIYMNQTIVVEKRPPR